MSDPMTDERYESINGTEHTVASRIDGNTYLARATNLADEHLKYVEDLLTAAGVPSQEIAHCTFHYKSAFVHGYKHAVEDMEDERKES